MDTNQIIVTYGNDPAKMTKDILDAAGLAGRLPDKKSLIGLKPNLVVAKPASSGATTTPAILAGTIEYLQEHGYHNLLILEGSWVGDSTTRAFKVCGYDALSKKYNVPLFDTKSDKYESRSYGGLTMEISRKALEVDYLINMPVLKGHCQTIVTGALKNMKGIISDREKRHFHTLGLHKPIAYLNKILCADFIIGDGMCGDLDFEEGGNPVQMNRVFCGIDPVLIDSYIASSMGYSPDDIRYIQIAAEIGVGSKDLDHAAITELNKDTTPVKPAASRKVQQLARYARQDDACSACYANLIQALARLDDAGKLRYLQKTPVCIGQGFKGKSEACPGVGSCTRDFADSVPGCPPKTPEILRFLTDYIAK
ncbi:DUF362 domain-containing protein [Anaerolentibacter hominis]|uniref:DUF362 domain-containing protein n=1 Tax=Anaerolentibacter hominis TaxID=3079009 RepID=UPI0031B8B1A1